MTEKISTELIEKLKSLNQEKTFWKIYYNECKEANISVEELEKILIGENPIYCKKCIGGRCAGHELEDYTIKGLIDNNKSFWGIWYYNKEKIGHNITIKYLKKILFNGEDKCLKCSVNGKKLCREHYNNYLKNDF